MNNLSKQNYFGDYFSLLDNHYSKEVNFMKSDIYEKDNQYIVEIDLPGVKKENISINYENGYLTIEAIKKEETVENSNYIRRERFYGEIKRSFFIGEKKETDIKASYQDGILNISFPKEDQPKKTSKNIIIK